jgi:hypothetical protein
MAGKSAIEWTGGTWNVVTGCTNGERTLDVNREPVDRSRDLAARVHDRVRDQLRVVARLRRHLPTHKAALGGRVLEILGIRCHASAPRPGSPG